MKYKIDTPLTKYNAKEAIKYLFETEKYKQIKLQKINKKVSSTLFLFLIL